MKEETEEKETEEEIDERINHSNHGRDCTCRFCFDNYRDDEES